MSFISIFKFLFWKSKAAPVKIKDGVIDRICAEVKLSGEGLRAYLARGNRNYAVRYIRNKKKQRKVYEPDKALYELQKSVVKNVFAHFPVSAYSTAYEKGCTIYNNADRHRKSSYMAHYDISNFFNSINYTCFRDLLEGVLDASEIKILWDICSMDGGLPVGAYSSPFISNRIMYAFDNRLANRFKKITYTRYADDLVFSSSKPLPIELESEIKNELYPLKMELNKAKTRIYSPKSSKRVTGVTVNPDGRLTVGKRYKLNLKKQLYNLTVKKRGNRQTVMGKLNYVKQIEPAYYKKLIKKYRVS